MAYFYVRDNPDGVGTASGDGGRYASQQTGDWDTTFTSTSEYYVSIEAAFGATTVPVAGDFIVVSHIHDHDYGNPASVTFVGAETGTYIALLSVDDTAIDEQLGGANEDNTIDLIVRGWLYIVGIDFGWTDDMLQFIANGMLVLNDCTVRPDGAADGLQIRQDGAMWKWNNVIMNLTNNTSGKIDISTGSIFIWDGGGYSGTAPTQGLIQQTPNAAGITVRFRNLDLDNVDTVIFDNLGDIFSDDTVDGKVNNCRFGSSTVLNNATLFAMNHTIESYNSSDSTTAYQHQFEKDQYMGSVSDATNIFRAESQELDDTTQISVLVESNSKCSRSSPLTFILPTQWCQFSVASTDTVRIFFVVIDTVTLTNADIACKVSYATGANANLQTITSNVLKISGQVSIDLFGTGITHTTDTGSDWRNGGSALTGYNEYFMDIPTSGIVGADCVPDIELSIYRSSTDIYIAPNIALVA